MSRDARAGSSGPAAKLALGRQLGHAIQLLRSQQLELAEKALLAILRRWPEQGDALHFMGVLKHNSGDSVAALAYIRHAIELMPKEAGPWNNLGNVLVEAQRFDEGEQAYLKCLEVQADFLDALSNLASIYCKRSRFVEAEALCRRAIAARSDFGQAWYNLSVALLGQKRISEGLAANSQAILLWPKHLQARDSVARALVYLGRLDEAAQLYREWLAVDPGNPVIEHHLAACSGQTTPQRASDGYVERTFDAFAATFDANLSALGYRAPQLVSELLGELLGPALASSSIADLGCGTGLCGPLVRPWASHLYGCDLSSGMLVKAGRRQVYDTLHHGELVEFLLTNVAAFDVLLCADTFCYFGDLALAIEAAAHALKPGGHLVFTLEALLDSAATGYFLQPHGRYAHGRIYVEQLLLQSGFRLEAVRQESLRMEAGLPVQGWLIGATAITRGK